MARFYFHVRDGDNALLDPDGVELDRDAVAEAALKAARDCIAHDARSGRIDLDQRIVVEDESGVQVHIIEFADAVELRMAPQPFPPLQ